METCRYCETEYQKSSRNILGNELWFANYDNHPVSPGHTKIIPRRHVNSFVELNHRELALMREIMEETESLIGKRFRPAGYNIGINQGKAAGQTVFHLHIHYIPRYHGDVTDPTGGVRNIIPGKGNYLKI